MKITYWCAENSNGGRCYSIRTKTKKEAIEKLQKLGCKKMKNKPDAYYADWLGNGFAFNEPRKITVEYKNAFDLVCKCLGEGGIEF